MTALIGAELSKLRRHSILTLAVIGALFPAVITVMVWYRATAGGFELTAPTLLVQSLLMVMLLEGPGGAAIIGSMLFGREYADRTLPNLLVSGLPRPAWLGAKWVALALLGLGIVLGSWGATTLVTLVAVGPDAMPWRMALASLAAHAVGAMALYATSAIPVALALGSRNQMVGAAWGVVMTVMAFMGLNSRYGILLPATAPWVAAQLALEALDPAAVGTGSTLASQYAWVGLPAGWTVALACAAVWGAGLTYSVIYVRRADFA
ncbi:ABC transporter permease [Geochorda subterranea]|uniref:ABC transporter permease n=1 Tax=Geochorda subterranea TaxID=3109564 RepID=A0ABZ1BLK2_9FIRM|nr:ABC transporter permease [Limnochorda sp. LNt]WRP13682.1 ABC transporter permease [Limnochorda sp. LNt]